MIGKKELQLSNQPKLLLTVDWLTINTEDKFKYLQFSDKANTITHGDFEVEQVQNGRTRHFNKQLNLWLSGNRVAVVTYDASNRVILNGRCHIKMENILFYDGTAEQICRMIVEQFHLQDIKISRLDLACDGVFFHEFLNKYLYDQNSQMGVRRVYDVDNIRPISRNRECVRTHSYDAFTIGEVGSKKAGKSKSPRFGRYYNKTRELSELNHKSYINEYFTNNGIGIDADVYRFEVEISAAFLSTIAHYWQSDILSLAFDNASRETLFRTACRQFFEFRYDTNSKIERCEALELFQGLQTAQFERLKRDRTDSPRNTKILIKRVVKDFHVGNFRDYNGSVGFTHVDQYNDWLSKRNGLIAFVQTLVQSWDLNEWLETKYQYWQREFVDHCTPRGIAYESVDIEIFKHRM